MDVRTLLFVFVVGWVVGSDQLPPALYDWFTARETIGKQVGTADCSYQGAQFRLKQVLVDVLPTPVPGP